MQGARVRIFLFQKGRIAGVAKSTSQVTRPMTEPLLIRVAVHEVETSGFEFCVSQLMILSFRPSTPPRALILLISSFADVSAGSSNGVIWPLRSIEAPMMIGPLALAPPDAVVAPIVAAVAPAIAASTSHVLHRFMLVVSPSLKSCGRRSR